MCTTGLLSCHLFTRRETFWNERTNSPAKFLSYAAESVKGRQYEEESYYLAFPERKQTSPRAQQEHMKVKTNFLFSLPTFKNLSTPVSVQCSV